MKARLELVDDQKLNNQPVQVYHTLLGVNTARYVAKSLDTK